MVYVDEEGHRVHPEKFFDGCTTIKEIPKAPFSKSSRKPYVCPVCSGRGFVAGGFYSSTGSTWVTTTTAPDECRSCRGTGVVWSD